MKNIKPSQLIRLAIHDLEIVEASPEYEVEMCTWHLRNDRQCTVCLAGAVMAVSLHAPWGESLSPEDYPVEQSKLLNALDSFRRGHVIIGLAFMGIVHHGVRNQDVVPHHVDSDQFKCDMMRMADNLEEKDL